MLNIQPVSKLELIEYSFEVDVEQQLVVEAEHQFVAQAEHKLLVNAEHQLVAKPRENIKLVDVTEHNSK